MLFWNRAGKVPNPVRWCRPCVTQSRKDDLLRHYGTETQDLRQHEWVKSDRIKMDVRALKSSGVVYKAPEQEQQWAVQHRVEQAQRSAAKNGARVDKLHGLDVTKDAETVQDLEVIGWTGKNLRQQIETIKSSGAGAVMIKIQKTEIHFIQAEMTA